ncbi:hypothetical protein LTR08_002394 [Meristemomyces frigidus]|nr:hypothetical protein LTR08_002394 [Meristemomyces frigidus]
MGIFIDALPAGHSFPKGPASDISSSHTFYLKNLPRDLFTLLPLTLVAYLWQGWLESTFPGRQRQRFSPDAARQAGEKKGRAADSDEELEQEIMHRLIAKGKVRRASISWFNTLVKWSLDNTLGVLFFQSAATMLSGSLKLQGVRKSWSELSVIRILLGRLFSTELLVSFIGFIIVPVQYRLPFAASVDLVVDFFFYAFLHVCIPWAMSREMMQDVLRNATESAWALHNATKNATGTVDESRLIGAEL